jgi:hypothetical protein
LAADAESARGRPRGQHWHADDGLDGRRVGAKSPAAELPTILQALAVAVPAREAVSRDANARGVEPPSLSLVKLAIAATSCRLH